MAYSEPNQTCKMERFQRKFQQLKVTKIVTVGKQDSRKLKPTNIKPEKKFLPTNILTQEYNFL